MRYPHVMYHRVCNLATASLQLARTLHPKSSTIIVIIIVINCHSFLASPLHGLFFCGDFAELLGTSLEKIAEIADYTSSGNIPSAHSC